MLRCARDFLIIAAITTFLSPRAGAAPKDNIWTSPSWVLPDLNGQLHKLRDQRRYAKQGLLVPEDRNGVRPREMTGSIGQVGMPRKG